MQPTKEQILEAINKSGYLFEQEVATIIENQNFYIQTNSAFKDLEENKSREIDVTGFKRFVYDKMQKLIIEVRIICECKNNTNPFVFISRKKMKSIIYILHQILFFRKTSITNQFRMNQIHIM